MKKELIIFVSLFFSISFSSAYYISGDIKINEYGESFFNVQTDMNLTIGNLEFNKEKETLKGQTEYLIKKEKGLWKFTLDLDNYETILLDITLPRNLKSIESISGVNYLIDFEEKKISLIDSNKPLKFEVSYKTENKKNFLGYFILLILFLIILYSFYFYNKKKESKKRLQHILPTINDNEVKIIEFLMKSKNPIRQKELRKFLNFPKASFSRYVKNLEKKKLIFLKGEGKNKFIQLK